MPIFSLYNPSEASHVDNTALVVADSTLYEGDHGASGGAGDNPLSAESNVFDSGGTAGTSLAVGNGVLGTSSTNSDAHMLFRITLPENPSLTASGDPIKDSSTVIKKVNLKFNVHSFGGSPTNPRIAYAPIVRAPHVIDYSAVTWNTSDGSTAWAASGAKSTGDRDTDTDFGAGSDGILTFQTLSTGWNSATLQDTLIAGPSSAKTVGFDWGTTVDIIVFPFTPSSFTSSGKLARIYGLEVSTASLKPYVEVFYEDTSPTKPEIKVKAFEDFRHAEISFTKRPDDEDLKQYVASWRQGGTPTYQTGASAPSYGKIITDTGKETYHGFNDLYNNGVGNSTFYPGGASDVGTTNELIFFAEDSNNTGASGATKGNTVSVTRYLPYTIENFDDSEFAKSCSCSWILIGKHTGSNNVQVLTDTTAGTTTPWLRGDFIKNVFDKIGVNWTNTTTGHMSDDAVSDIDDFDIIELDSPSSDHTVSYRYSTPGTYYPNFFFVDSATGFRTPFRQLGQQSSSTETGFVLDDADRAALVVEQPKPVPRLTSSKSVGESANVALDKGSAVVYSGANSTVGGSDSFIKEWRWLGEPHSGQILTQGCLDIDNTPLIDESKKLYMRCNTAGYNATVFTIYGLASFEEDNATPVKDTGTTFSHYRYVKATVSAGANKYLKHDTSGAFGDAARTDSSAPDTEMFFKQVDFVYATTKSGTSGTEEVFQLLAADSDNDGTIDAAGTLDINTVCKRLCIDSNNTSPGYKWGGLCTVTGSTNITFTKNSGAGFGPGDTITIENTSNDGVYTIQKLETTSGPVHTLFLNEELTLAETATATIFTSQPTISVAASASGSAKISLDVKDNQASTAEAAVHLFTTFRDQTNLDLNATADSGNIAIQNASLSRSGGMSAAMPLGERRYPPNAVHTKHGLPKMNMTVRVIDSTGFARMYRLLNNSYNYAVYQHHDSTFASWVKYRLKLESFTVNRDPQNLQHQTINMSFFVVGEEV